MASAGHVAHVSVVDDAAQHCCSAENGSSSSQKDLCREDDKCPSDHHHHSGCCSHPLPLTVGNDPVCRLGISDSSDIGVSHESDLPPEEPFLSPEKPPLI
jgi:hypothetical protein